MRQVITRVRNAKGPKIWMGKQKNYRKRRHMERMMIKTLESNGESCVEKRLTER